MTDIVLWYGKTKKRGIAGKHPRTRQSRLLYTLFENSSEHDKSIEETSKQNSKATHGSNQNIVNKDRTSGARV